MKAGHCVDPERETQSAFARGAIVRIDNRAALVKDPVHHCVRLLALTLFPSLDTDFAIVRDRDNFNGSFTMLLPP